MKEVFIVSCLTGEYDGAHYRQVCAFKTQEEAQDFVTVANEFLKLWGIMYNDIDSAKQNKYSLVYPTPVWDKELENSVDYIGARYHWFPLEVR